MCVFSFKLCFKGRNSFILEHPRGFCTAPFNNVVERVIPLAVPGHLIVKVSTKWSHVKTLLFGYVLFLEDFSGTICNFFLTVHHPYFGDLSLLERLSINVYFVQ